MKDKLSSSDIDREKKSHGLDTIINTIPELQQPQYAALNTLLKQPPEVEISCSRDKETSQTIQEVEDPGSPPGSSCIDSLANGITPLSGSDISSGVLYGTKGANATSLPLSDANQDSFVSRLEKGTNNQSFSR